MTLIETNGLTKQYGKVRFKVSVRLVSARRKVGVVG